MDTIKRQAAETESDDELADLLKRLKAVRTKVENLKPMLDEADAFFGIQAGATTESGQNLVRVFTLFKASSHPAVKACDVESQPEAILILSVRKKITVNGVYSLGK